MRTFRHSTTLSTLGGIIVIVGALLLIGLPAHLHAIGIGAGQTGPGMGLNSRGFVTFTGDLMCVDCRLDAVRQAQPEAQRLYQFTHQRRPVVILIRQMNDCAIWERIPSARLIVRAQDSVFRPLTIEENIAQEVRLSGLLRNTRTFDLYDVSIHPVS